jgi:hypothetical protein
MQQITVQRLKFYAVYSREKFIRSAHLICSSVYTLRQFIMRGCRGADKQFIGRKLAAKSLSALKVQAA